MKSVTTLHRLKEVVLTEEEQGPAVDNRVSHSIEEDEEERKARKKRTLQTIKSGSTKYMLPALTKTNKDESLGQSKTEFEELCQTTKAEAGRSFDAEDGRSEKDAKKDNLSKTSVLKKSRNDKQKMLTITPAREKKGSLE